jgi:carbon-monoxide dehydrogenase medium subunit
MLLGARLTIAGARRTRVVDMKDFMHGPFRTAIEPDEVLTSIEFRTISADARWGYYKVCRKGGEYPDAIGAVLFDRLRNIQRIIVGALDVAPQLLESLAMIVGQQNRAPESQMILDAIAGIAPDLSDVDLQLHAAAVRRAIVQAVS